MTTHAPAALRPEIDLDVCKGHGRCYMTAPDVFDCDDDGYPVVLGSATTSAAIREVERAAANCPEKAITLHPDVR
ncbi:ferredoxin [Nocardioides sp. TRM66260-LWL]|uniref:ferredoxin n=1 Tax=Nocardioides sp. TRM66260-LWL TaxID=2874478 RepID=UPI001CC4A297|nr:ferredoxin [Nocardioides sp. TRM66260-LWL]MBZ5735319.1 ferredoxin [Nocardioides sp. TRM66260-LWL]